MIITNKNELYNTSDICFATAISLWYPIHAIDKSNPRKAIFIFQKTSDLEQFITDYLRGEIKVSPQAFFNQLRTVKTHLYNIE